MSKSNSIIQWSAVQLFFMTSIVSSVMFGVYAPNIISTSALNPQQFGFVAGVFFICFAICQFFAGRWLVSISPKIILATTALIATVGSFLVATATSFPLLLVARGLLGVGLSTTYVGVLFMAQTKFPSSEFPVMSSLSQCLANFLGALFVFFAAYILFFSTYHAFFKGLACAYLISAILILLLVSGETSTEKNQSSLLSDMRVIVKNPQIWLAIVYFAGVFGSVLSFSNIYSISYQTLAFGRSVGHVVPITGTVILGVSIGSIIAGILMKKLGDYTRVAKVFPCMSLVCFIGILFFRFNAAYFEVIGMVIYFIFGFGLGGFVMAFQCVQENVAEQNLRPLASSFVLTVSYIFVGFIEQPVVGALLSRIKTAAAIPHFRYLLDFSDHDDFYRYSISLSFVLFMLLLAVIGSFFFKSEKSRVNATE